MKTNTPRPEQVAELTRGIALPLPAINEEHLFIIVETLAKVWSDLLAEHADLLKKKERYINTLMATRLKKLRDEGTDIMWDTLVSSVARGEEMISYDGSHLEKRPDLSLVLTKPRLSAFPFVIECKLIDAETKSVRLYCKNGLARFIEGEYAWYDRQAIMMAYVRDTSAIATNLTPYLGKYRNNKTDPFASEQLPQAIETTDMDLDLAQSRHGRKFCYTEPPHNAPGSIKIWHLWVSDTV
uniref:Uncharacterized protein n=1 Tax=Candidatus Kentrum sp. MB TaxID=2138164 RepID=A0A451B792_9GAMM|nr:MAG: hypothetical protein BECKMB1821G_GA0114241_100285 [Candidatus Kentron sp. MB]VFK28935.1 MAG: hypothetical protein BECKMB1821I_GA0114274_100791 [Candidatus Kentron sp. MB]VFK74158.1 MAG: hypothetical protein BECKMB1821H_GA0114242_100189 [Candidatus Kentron sp. MB]